METEPIWHELLGSNNWEGLLEPLNLNLRQLILRCGDFCQATYDAFNNDQNSKYCGTSRYGKKSFFQKVMLQSASNYKISGFLYATARIGALEAIFLHSLSREAWDRESNWIGYIAVTTDEVTQELGRREIYVVFRGTTRNYEWINVLGARPESADSLLRPKSLHKSGVNGDNSKSSSDDDENEPKIMDGWLKIYVSSNPNSPFTKLSAREQLQTKVEELRQQYKDENLSITFTGHSLGASLATLAAFDVVENGVTDIPVSAIVFGSPQVGNKAFNEKIKEYSNLKILHVKNKIDLIPLYPSALLGYANTGTELVIDSRKSPSLKDSRDTGDWHNLQGMLHVVAGWNGEDKEFELQVKRSVALVNKSSSFLKDEYLIPGSWWVEKNRSMVLDENGEWIMAPPSDEDLPVPEY
nr:phospholipase A1-IIdelta-like isoform X2 [Nicotiana tomentosiformis]